MSKFLKVGDTYYNIDQVVYFRVIKETLYTNGARDVEIRISGSSMAIRHMLHKEEFAALERILEGRNGAYMSGYFESEAMPT